MFVFIFAIHQSNIGQKIINLGSFFEIYSECTVVESSAFAYETFSCLEIIKDKKKNQKA